MTPSEFARLRKSFPNLTGANFRVTSPVDVRYNCIAWAGGDATRWWEPNGLAYWPTATLNDYSVSNYVSAYRTLGYTDLTTEEYDPDLDKVALFCSLPDPFTPSIATHAARQLPDGWWASKLGRSIDIEHELRAVEGPTYGSVSVILARVKRK